MVLLFNIHFITIMPVIICGLLTIKKSGIRVNTTENYEKFIQSLFIQCFRNK